MLFENPILAWLWDDIFMICTFLFGLDRRRFLITFGHRFGIDFQWGLRDSLKKTREVKAIGRYLGLLLLSYPECLSLGFHLISPPAKVKDKGRVKVNRAWQVVHTQVTHCGNIQAVT